MALIMSYETNVGLTLTGAYLKVRSATVDKETIKAIVDVYASETARNAGKKPIQTGSIATPYVDTGSLAAVYAALKVKYPEATDC